MIAAMVVILILLFVLLLVGLRRAWRRFQHRMTISHSEFGGDGEK